MNPLLQRVEATSRRPRAPALCRAPGSKPTKKIRRGRRRRNPARRPPPPLPGQTQPRRPTLTLAPSCPPRAPAPRRRLLSCSLPPPPKGVGEGRVRRPASARPPWQAWAATPPRALRGSRGGCRAACPPTCPVHPRRPGWATGVPLALRRAPWAGRPPRQAWAGAVPRGL